MAELVMERSMRGLVPADESSAEMLKAWAPGEVIRIKASRMRNGRNHRRFMKLLQVCADNLDSPVTVDQLLFCVKLATGHCDEVILPSGEVQYVPRSISFARMDEPEFRQFYSNASKYLCANWLYCSEAELAEYVGLL